MTDIVENALEKLRERLKSSHGGTEQERALAQENAEHLLRAVLTPLVTSCERLNGSQSALSEEFVSKVKSRVNNS